MRYLGLFIMLLLFTGEIISQEVVTPNPSTPKRKRNPSEQELEIESFDDSLKSRRANETSYNLKIYNSPVVTFPDSSYDSLSVPFTAMRVSIVYRGNAATDTLKYKLRDAIGFLLGGSAESLTLRQATKYILIYEPNAIKNYSILFE